MKIELNPVDTLSRLLYDKHKEGASVLSSTPPCTVCRKPKPEGSVRGHFSGSDFFRCMLAVYNDCNNGVIFEDPLEGKIELDDKAPFLLDGHLHEESIIKNIAASGMTIIHMHGDEYEKQIQVYVRKGNNGRHDFVMPHKGSRNEVQAKEGFEEAFKLICHLDGLLEVKSKKTGREMLVGVECKAVKDYTWKKIKETSEIPNTWYGQMQAYFLTNHSIERYYLFIKHRHTSQLMKPILILRNDEFINRRLNILYRVYNAILEDDPKKYNIEKEHDSPKDSECKFCPYKQQCYGKAVLNTVSNDSEDE